MNSLFNQYEAARSSTEKEERKLLQQQGLNPQDRVFTAEEVIKRVGRVTNSYRGNA